MPTRQAPDVYQAFSSTCFFLPIDSLMTPSSLRRASVSTILSSDAGLSLTRMAPPWTDRRASPLDVASPAATQAVSRPASTEPIQRNARKAGSTGSVLEGAPRRFGRGGLAHLGAGGGGQQREGEAVDLLLVEAAAEVDARADVAPLVVAAHLQLAAVVAVEDGEVVGLQDHVVELDERQARLHARLHRSRGSASG